MAEENKTRVDESLSKGTLNKSLTGNSDQRVDLTNYEVSPSGNIQPPSESPTNTTQNNATTNNDSSGGQE